jgi:hypothetical protein
MQHYFHFLLDVTCSDSPDEADSECHIFIGIRSRFLEKQLHTKNSTDRMKYLRYSEKIDDISIFRSLELRQLDIFGFSIGNCV